MAKSTYNKLTTKVFEQRMSRFLIQTGKYFADEKNADTYSEFVVKAGNDDMFSLKVARKDNGNFLMEFYGSDERKKVVMTDYAVAEPYVVDCYAIYPGANKIVFDTDDGKIETILDRADTIATKYNIEC